MKIVCAPDSFKGSMTAVQAAAAMAQGARAVNPEVELIELPLADGGEGTTQTLVAAAGGEMHSARVTGPLGEQVEAQWGLINSGATGVIELAAAAGLTLVPEDQRDPARTTTYGVGELIRIALDAGVDHLILGLGGSSTNDGGTGMAQALGVRFFDVDGELMSAVMTGGRLSRLGVIDLSGLDGRLARVRFEVACDVSNPMCGANGSAAVYGPQKGASPAQVTELDSNLKRLVEVWSQLDEEFGDAPGYGAAGGAGGGAAVLLGGTLRRGIDMVLDACRFAGIAAGADLLLTGEGMLDGQSLSGKTILGVTRRYREVNPSGKAFALIGAKGDGWQEAAAELDGVVAIGEGLPLSESMQRAEELLREATARVVSARQHR